MEVFHQLWEAILELTARLVIPDWDAVVALIPIGLAGLVALYLVWIAARFATAGPTVRGRQRVRPLP
ncbi:MAG TPA: hypothetical protein VNJ28_07400, partial [Candidatus Limnocylindrales bacterium]|nr:hypothetical protein [Candidatus Limnocylindrales bacterium]